MKILIFGLAASMLCAGLIAQPANAQGQAQPNPETLVHADRGVVEIRGAAIPVNKSFGANAGEIVDARNGQATITFNTGCAVKIEAREYTIPATVPLCSSGTIPLTGDGKQVALGIAGAAAVVLAIGSGGGGGGNSDPPSSP